MALTLNLAECKIGSFFANGFLSGADLQQHMQKESDVYTIATSYDAKLRDQVPLNCISKIQGVKTSLLHQAKGGLVVMVEEKVGQGGILDAALQRNLETIKVKKQELSSLPSSYIEPVARNLILSTDKEFLEAITEKVHQTALFLLKDLQVESGENGALDGCQETGRSKIAPDKILSLILPRIYEGAITNVPADKIKFVASTSSEFVYCYKDEKDVPQQIKIKDLMIPNYAATLEQFASETQLSTNPIYTHMTRLPKG